MVGEFVNEDGETGGEILIWLELPEMGVVGWSVLFGVLKVDNFDIGNGNLVIGIFCHLAPETMVLVIGDVDPIGCTSSHPSYRVRIVRSSLMPEN
jgi:hypothetical protein